MKTSYFLPVVLLVGCAGILEDRVYAQVVQADTIPDQIVKVDTVYVEKVRVDTVWYEKKQVDPLQEQAQNAPSKDQKSAGKNDKVYYGGYANFSFGQYTLIGFEPMIAYKIFPKFSLGGKFSYQYVNDKRYETDQEASNYGVSLFARRRFFKRLYAHLEYAQMNYKLYDSQGDSDRTWVPFLYLGGGISLPVTRTTSLNAEVLWDLIQDSDSPYKTLQPFFNVGIGVGF